MVHSLPGRVYHNPFRLDRSSYLDQNSKRIIGQYAQGNLVYDDLQ